MDRKETNWINRAKFHFGMLQMAEKASGKTGEIRDDLRGIKLYRLIHEWDKQWKKGAELKSKLPTEEQTQASKNADEILNQIFV